LPSTSGTSSTGGGVRIEDEVALATPEEDASADDDRQSADQIARQRKRAELQKELGLIKVEIAAIRRDTNGAGGGLDRLRTSLENLKEEIDKNDPDPYSQEEIDAHNAKVRRYEDLRSRFNKSVKEYNRKLLQERKKVRRHNEIVDSLNASR
jgi:chromosome segregation ATPase